MKKYFYKSFLALAVLFTSCGDFLDTEPLSFTTPSNFYKTAGDFEVALIGCYGQLGASYGVNYRTGVFLIGNLATDELLSNPYSSPDAESNMDQFLHGRLVKSNRNIRDIWEKFYTAIYAQNDLLKNLASSEVDEQSKMRIEAETRFLRGWHYMYLGMIFGGVPVYTSTPHDDSKGRDKLEDVMMQALADLEFAYEKMPANTSINPTRASKWSAAGYLARLYCYLASAKKYNVGNSANFALNSFDWVNIDEFYDKALECIETIENQSSFTLVDDYRYLFVEGSVDKQKDEILFTIAPSPEKKIGFGLMYYLLPVGSQGGGWGTIRPSQEVLSKYNRDMDARAGWVVGGLANVDLGTETIDGKSYYKIANLSLSGSGEAYDGDYSVTKFRYVSSSTKHEDIYWGYYPLLRFGEILLLKAEVVAHKEGDTQAREVLKPLRNRALVKGAGYTAENLSNLYSRTDFITELLEERTRELCFEQHRRFDLIRFNRYESTVKSVSLTFGVWNRNGARQLVENVSDQMIWYPIPEEDELANPNLLPNNPGY